MQAETGENGNDLDSRVLRRYWLCHEDGQPRARDHGVLGLRSIAQDVEAAYAARYTCAPEELRVSVKHTLAEWFGTARGYTPDWDVAPGLVKWVGDPGLDEEAFNADGVSPQSRLDGTNNSWQFTAALGYAPGDGSVDRASQARIDAMTHPGRYAHSARPDRRGEHSKNWPTLLVFATTEPDTRLHRIRLVARTVFEGVISGPTDKLPHWAREEMDELQLAVDKDLAKCRVAR